MHSITIHQHTNNVSRGFPWKQHDNGRQALGATGFHGRSLGPDDGHSCKSGMAPCSPASTMKPARAGRWPGLTTTKSWCCMSHHDITRIPTSLRRDDGRAPKHAPKMPETTSAEYERQLQHLIGHGRPFAEIEERIDRIPLSDEEKSALWLYAWSLIETTLADRGAHPTLAGRLSALWRCAWSFTEIVAHRSGGSRPAGWGSGEPDCANAMAAGGPRVVAINGDRYDRPNTDQKGNASCRRSSSKRTLSTARPGW